MFTSKGEAAETTCDGGRAALEIGANVFVASKCSLAVNGMLRELHAPGAIARLGVGHLGRVLISCFFVLAPIIN